MPAPGTLLKSVVFDVKDGNEDRDNLSDPANYGLENTNNIYFPPLSPAADTDRIAGWFIRCSVHYMDNSFYFPHWMCRSLEAPSATVSVPLAGGDTCPEAGCSSGLGVAELGAGDCVFILLHGNAKVNCQYLFSAARFLGDTVRNTQYSKMVLHLSMEIFVHKTFNNGQF